MMTRLLSCLRCGIFLIITLLITVTLFWFVTFCPLIASIVYNEKALKGTITPWGVIGEEILQLFAVFLAAFIVVYIFRKPKNDIFTWSFFLKKMMLYDQFWLKKSMIGLLWGFVLASIVIVLITFFQGYTIKLPLLSMGDACLKIVGYIVTFLCVAVTEECIFRGYLYVELQEEFNFLTASFITSILFGLVHILGGTSLLGALSTVVIGFIFCLMLCETGSIFFSIGFHAAWDWTQTALFGVNDSGHSAYGSLLHTEVHGSSFLTGGQGGPEASIICFMVYVLSIILYFVIQSKVKRNIH